MSLLFNLNISVIWCAVKNVDREVTAVVIAPEFSSSKQ